MMNLQYNSDIKKHRTDLGLTQKQAAEILNRTERRYHGWENGERELERWEFLGIMASLTEGAKNYER